MQIVAGVSSPAGGGINPNITALIRYYPRIGFSFRMDNVRVYGKNTSPASGTDGTLIATLPTGHTETWYTVTLNVDYKYIWFYWPSTYSSVAEMEFFSIVSPTKITPAGYFGSAAFGGSASNDYNKAFDGNTGTNFDSAATSGGYCGAQIY